MFIVYDPMTSISVMPSPFQDSALASSTHTIDQSETLRSPCPRLLRVHRHRSYGFQKQKLCAGDALRHVRNGVTECLLGYPLHLRPGAVAVKVRFPSNLGGAVASFPRKREDRNSPPVHLPVEMMYSPGGCSFLIDFRMVRGF
jgi:hypothetical protein